MIQKRSIAAAIILSIVTCGLYSFYWMAKLNDDANTASGTFGTSGGMVILLSLVTCGIYAYYWAFKQGEKIDLAKRNRNQEAGSNNIIYLILCLFGFLIVALALMQNELNQMANA